MQLLCSRLQSGETAVTSPCENFKAMFWQPAGPAASFFPGHRILFSSWCCSKPARRGPAAGRRHLRRARPDLFFIHGLEQGCSPSVNPWPRQLPAKAACSGCWYSVSPGLCTVAEPALIAVGAKAANAAAGMMIKSTRRPNGEYADGLRYIRWPCRWAWPSSSGYCGILRAGHGNG